MLNVITGVYHTPSPEITSSRWAPKRPSTSPSTVNDPLRPEPQGPTLKDPKDSALVGFESYACDAPGSCTSKHIDDSLIAVAHVKVPLYDSHFEVGAVHVPEAPVEGDLQNRDKLGVTRKKSRVASSKDDIAQTAYWEEVMQRS
jgi:hypothetical protein